MYCEVISDIDNIKFNTTSSEIDSMKQQWTRDTGTPANLTANNRKNHEWKPNSLNLHTKSSAYNLHKEKLEQLQLRTILHHCTKVLEN